jgi:hypothetical protein
MPFRDDDRQGLDPREFPDPDETDEGRMPCPHCLAVIWDESERCPACGRYLSEEDTPRRHPWWVVLGVLICLALALYWIWPVP